jgi:hypothetical protein
VGVEHEQARSEGPEVALFCHERQDQLVPLGPLAEHPRRHLTARDETILSPRRRGQQPLEGRLDTMDGNGALCTCGRVPRVESSDVAQVRAIVTRL